MHYNDLGIFELRSVAREIGVKYPSTLKKDDLINQIEQIKAGKKEPYTKKTKQGRPVKKITGQIIIQNLTSDENLNLLNENLLNLSPESMLKTLQIMQDFYSQNLTIINNTISRLNKVLNKE